jgi:hypothetical protein
VTEIIELGENDGFDELRSRLRDLQGATHVAIVLPWDARLLSRDLDCELLQREADRLALEVAVVTADPDRRRLIRRAGLATFWTVEEAKSARVWDVPERESVEPPPRLWWEVERPPELPRTASIPWLSERVRQGVRAAVFVLTLLVVLVSAYVVIPQATITIYPAGETFRVITPVSVGIDLETVDTAAAAIPARRVGDYFEGFIEVETTGTVAFQSGRSTGNVLFTNLLPQDVTVPTGTVMRTSSSSFPVRFATRQEVLVPARGQASAPVEALVDGPVGNVDINQINQVEGVAGFAIRVTNPEPTIGGATNEMRAVSQEDMDRAWELLAEQLLNEAHGALQVYLEPTEFIPAASLGIQGYEMSYNRFLNERADTIGLHMRLLISGLAVDQDNAEAAAYAALMRRVPGEYELIGTMFELGEVAEEPSAMGNLTFYATATGYAAARMDADSIREMVLGQARSRAVELLDTELPLDQTPQVTVWPEWFPRMPVLPVRIAVDIIPQS